MINLLPPEQKREIRAARANSSIVKYIIFVIASIIFLVIALFGTYTFLQASESRAEETRIQNERRSSDYIATQQAAASLRTNISSAKTLFDSEYRYSLALLRLSQLLPPGTALKEITLSPANFDSPTTLPVLISGESAAITLRNSLTDSPYIQSVTLGAITINESDNQYPYTIDVTLTISRSIAQ